MVNELLLQKIYHHAKSNPNKIALKFLEGNFKNSQELTYRQLTEKIDTLATTIFTLNNKEVQQPILLLFESSLDYIVSFLAILHSNNIAVTAYPPRQTRHLQRLLKIVEDSHAKIVLTTAKIKKYCEINHFEFPTAPLICVDELELEKSNLIIPTAAPEDIAFLQYTSGSTGAPKGVVVTQQNIVRNLELSIDYVGMESVNTCVSWLPIFHDMGLIGNTLLPLYAGGTCVFMAPLTFLKKPFFWLQKISEEKCTYTMAPNFSYDLAITSLEQQKSIPELDLSHVNYLINGAEPVKAETIKRVEKVLSAYGLRSGAVRPGYGMAEATLVISVHVDESADSRTLLINKDELALGRAVPDQTGNAIEVVRCGKVASPFTLRIVDPDTNKKLPKRCVGEIWIQGACIAKGYYRNEEKTASIFNAFTANGEGPFLRTGDLAFIDDEGYLIISGRLKDLMIINGRNIYPQDVEKACYTSDSHLIIDGAAAFSIPGEISEECIIVAEVKNHLDAAVYKDILAKIQDNVFQAQDIIPTDIVLIPPKRLLKTSSGKVQRNACKQAYLNEEFSIIARLKQASKDIPKTQTIDFTQSEQDVVSHWLKQWLSINTQIDYNHIDEHRPFSEYGLSSVKLVSMMSELEQYIQQDLDPLMAWEFPNIHALTQRLTNHLQVTSCQPQQTYEPIAVIGMDCRIPCDEQSNLIGIEAFWRFLQTESDSIRPIPQERWDIRQYYDPNPDKKGMMYTTAGSFLADVKRFDAKFFNISPREAEYLDPQQRLALMVTWNALEDAGIVPQQLKDSKTGIYLGISTHDYDALIQKQVPLEELNTYQATGTSFATAAGRIAYFLGTHGPCMAIDTACSSSLVSIHQASRALQDRDCHLAIAGGVNLILSPEGNIIFCKSAMLSPKNRCSTFDAEADGYVRGEGCGIVILKRLADALRDNNKIYAVIHGSSVNQDGASNGLTAPNVGAQIEVMESAIKSANLTPDQITHVEAHGTGTSLGDPIEWEGIRRVYASARKKPLYITSLKTRIGHLEAAAGVAGFIKTVLATQYGQIPGHLHLKQFNPKITQQEGMQVPAQLLPWQEKYRYAGVSSFGFSGTNAHIILGNFNREETATEEKQSRSHYLWVVSARDEETLKHYLQTYCDYSQSLTGCDFAAISQKSLTERTHFSHRAFIVAKNCQDWAQALTTKEWQQGKANEKNKVAWLFTGQGCLEPDVAAVLYHTLPAFAAIIDECCAITEPLLDYKLRDVLLHTPVQVDINHTHFAQPALFVFEYALAKWFLSLGVQPALLLGHSLGEYVAACVAEVMSLREALQLVCLRAQLINTLPDNGAMLAIAASANEVETLLIHFPELTISVKNSAQQTVVSGTKEAIDALQNYCLQQELRCKKIATSHAFHSSLMIPIVDKFYQQAQSIDYKPAKIPIISNVTGVELSHTIDASYWCEHLTKTVEFHKGLQTLAEKNITLVQEIGPKAVLTAQAQDACNFLIVPSIRDPKEPWPSLCESLGILYLKGVDLQWNLLNPLSDVTKYTLPKYPFFGKEYWLPTPKNKPANLSYSWRKNLYKLGWRQLTEKPATGNYQNKELTIISPAISSEAPLLLILRNHYKTINFITPDRFVKPEFLQKINEAEALVYFCNANDDEVETEFNNIGLVTRFLLENTPEKPFVFLNNQPRDAISKTGRASLALLKSIKQEYPVWQVRYLEGDFLNDNPQWVHSLQNTINGHWVLRYENQAYYRRQILPLEPNLLTGNRQVYPENTYLVTGACGGIGQILIETLLELGVKHIVAVGRKKTPAAWSTSIQSFLQKGEAQVHYQQCDVSQSAQVTQLIAEIEHELPPLGVIIHAAGITIDKPWLATSNEEIKAIIAGKALGALHLHLATANHPLKEFICISSISGVLGNQGQAAYAAANAFLDALGEQRKAEGKPSFNLILGPVTKTGLFKNNEEKLTEYLAMQGIEPLDPEIIKLILGAQEKENNIIIAQFNGDINAIEEEGHSAQSTVVESDEENVLESQCVAADILKIVQQILKLTTDELSVSDNWFEAGMDSILAAQVVYKINTKCRGNVVTSKDIFRYSTAEELAQKINSTALSKKTVIAKEIHPNSTPLSLQQQEIWNFLKHCQDYRAYQIPMELAIKGSLDVEEFKNSVKKVGERHDIFQVGFHEVLGQVSQHYHQQAVINLEIGSHYNEKEVSEFLSAPFDLKMPPLIRTKLIKVAEDEYRWLLVFHHLISDGNTVNAFIGEVILDYENQPIESTKQYYQYVNWQWNTIHYQLDTNLRDYWMNSLKGIPLDVPSEYTNHTVENIKKDDRHPERSQGAFVSGDVSLRST
ncbi:type I polyketide synthase [Legionella jamestowniensis]|uniref:type I polyketide synthase n=1 Tax=Legionella jamestowniensis TaxID=455 RepID=UPI0010412D1D|nr:type I polyketide synthase [Legionella jamestowniensis]